METTTVRQLLRSLCTISPWSYAVFWKLQQQSPILVGGVALSGNDLWIDSDDTGSIEFPDALLLPMKAGIKTTLLAPILPHGVLQLGSLEKVAKNPAMVADVKAKFIALHSTMFTTSSVSNANGLLFSSTPVPELDRDDSSLSRTSLHNITVSEYPEEICTGEIAHQVMLPPMIGDCLQPDDVTAISRYTFDEDVPFLYLDLDVQPDTENQFVNADIMNTTEDIWTFAFQEEGYFDAGVPEALSSGIHNYLTPEEIQLVPELQNGDETGLVNVGEFIGFVSEPELQEVLGAALQTECDRHSWSSEEENVYVGGGFVPLAMEPSGWFGEGDDQGHLLEAVVTSLCNNSDETISYWCNSGRSSVTSFAEIAPSFQVQTSNEVMADMEREDTTDVLGDCTALSGHPSAFARQLTSPSSFESLVSGVTEEEQPMNYSRGLPNESAEIPKVRGKSRHKISQRPRPRDRQLIQDRLKELRDLVPNGEKCSIDGLLDQAIKHMMFLKSVTQQAEKMKQFSDHEGTDTTRINISEL